MDTDVDVLVIGAGPTGLMLANQLVRRGVRTTIIDRHAGPSLQTRALGVHARTLEIYARLGVVDRALALGTPATGVDLWADGEPTARVPFGDAGSGRTPYPYVLILGQDDNERILGDHLAGLGQAVQWNTELVALDQHAGHVDATLRQPDGSMRTVRAAWVGGCDGARSAVRTLNGIDFPGAPYEHVFFVADVTADDGTMVPGEINVYLWREGFHLFFPMRGERHWRVVGILPPALRGHDAVGIDDVLPSLREEAGPQLAVDACSWFSTYRIHHRSAARFRDRRAFVLGDAAHIHSPVGAQGMNTGLQDAHNLAWKLALVVQRRADETLLDSYEAERMPVAQRLLATTDRAFRLVVSDNPLAGLLRTQVLARAAALAMSRPAIRRRVFRTVSQTGIHYRDSMLSCSLDGLPAGAPRAGDRFPWLRLVRRPGGPAEDLYDAIEDTCFTLVRIGDTTTPPEALQQPFGALLQVLSIPADPANTAALQAARIPQPSFFLLRPDGHVALCGVRPDAALLAGYATSRLGWRLP